MKSTYTTKIFIFSIALLFFSIGVAGYAFYSVDKRGEQLIEDVKVLKNHYYLKSEYQRLKVELDESSDERAQLSNLVLEDENGAVTFLSLVDWLAKDLNLSLTTRQLTEEVTKEAGFDELFVEFGVSGDARATIKFIQLLELLPYHSRVVAVSVARKYNSQTQAELIEAVVSLRISIKEK